MTESRAIEPARLARAAEDLDIQSLGQVMAQSGFFRDTREAAQAIVKIQAGKELGFGPVASMTGIFIIEGRVSVSASIMGAAVQRSGRYNFRVMSHTETECVIEFTERDKVIGVSAFRLGDAIKAGIGGKDVWKKYPRNMLFARAMSNGVRWFCPSIFGGPLYTPEELDATVDGTGVPVEAPAKRPIQVFAMPSAVEAFNANAAPNGTPPAPPSIDGDAASQQETPR